MSVLGNKNATKNRPWAAAINRALAQGNAERLRNLAEKLIDKALKGDMAALKELGDRVDGKSLATIEYTGELSVTDLTDAQLDQRLRDLNSE